MTEWLKKWAGIISSVMVILGAMGAALAYADSLIDQRVETKLAGLLTKKLEAVERRIGGIQEQTNSGVADQRVIKEQLKSIERQQQERDKALEKQLELIIKLIERRE